MTISSLSSQGRRRSPVRVVQDGIRGIESAIDDTIVKHGALLIDMIEVSKQAGLAPAYGQEALERAVDGLTATLTSRAHAITAHEAMRVAIGRVCIKELGWGDMGESPPTTGQAGPEPITPLRVVAED